MHGAAETKSYDIRSAKMTNEDKTQTNNVLEASGYRVGNHILHILFQYFKTNSVNI